MSLFLDQLITKFPHLDFKENFPLAPLTTVKIGGPAEIFCETKTQEEFSELVSFAKKNDIPLTLLGWGANTLISDKGIKGLVVKNLAKEITIHGDEIISENPQKSGKSLTTSRWNSDKTTGTHKYEFADLDYDESHFPRIRVTMDSGVPLSYAINFLLNQGITGLQWYSRIPATIGGAIFNNIHGGTHFIEEILESVIVVTPNGDIKNLPTSELNMEYDHSRFHTSKEVIVSADFLLYKGDADKAKQIAQEWAIRKKIQPQNSLGCTFKNISNEEREALAYPTTSVGYIVEHILGKKGFQIGDAKVSHHHAAFIENVGQATAKDYLDVIKTIIAETKTKTGIQLVPEIFFLGFDKEELEGVI